MPSRAPAKVNSGHRQPILPERPAESQHATSAPTGTAFPHHQDVLAGIPESARAAAAMIARPGVRRFSSPISGLVITRKILKERRVNGEVEVEAEHRKFQANVGLVEVSEPEDIAFLESYAKRKPGMLVDLDKTMQQAQQAADDAFIQRAQTDPRLRDRVLKEFGGSVFDLPGAKNPTKDGPGAPSSTPR